MLHPHRPDAAPERQALRVRGRGQGAGRGQEDRDARSGSGKTKGTIKIQDCGECVAPAYII